MWDLETKRESLNFVTTFLHQNITFQNVPSELYGNGAFQYVPTGFKKGAPDFFALMLKKVRFGIGQCETRKVVAKLDAKRYHAKKTDAKQVNVKRNLIQNRKNRCNM